MDKSGLSRRGLLGATGLSAAGAALAAQQTAAAPSRSPAGKPNLILFLPDELRADALACYGNPVCRTPNLDRLAATGVRFTNCHVQYPVCGASRCSLLSGWPVSVRGHRSLYYFLRPYEPNLFRYLKQGGYDVFWYGKNDALASESFYDSVTEWNYFGPGAPPAAAREENNTRNPWPANDPMYYSFLFEGGGDRRRTVDYRSVEAGIHILERKEQDRPFCLFLPLGSPHPPYAGPSDFHGMYDPAALPALRPIGLAKRPDFHEGIRRAYNISSLSEATFRKIRAVYLGMVSYTDWLLGETLEAMDRTGRSKDTAIFVFSDHGDYGGDYGLVEKWPSGLEDPLTHVPLIGRMPGGVAGHVVNEMNEQFDVMATCLDLAGIQARHTHFSRSLAPQLRGQAGDPGRAAFAEGGYNIYEPQCFEPVPAPGNIYYPKTKLEIDHPEMVSRAAMVRTRDHKLILRPQGQSELYAYRDDPHELHNLYDEAGAAAVQRDLERRLAVWYLETTGIAPWDKDPRASPLFVPTPEFSSGDWRRGILDKG
jgi:choline-sulfatase